MIFQSKCLFCGDEYSDPDYVCSCKSKPWTRRYRSIDIEIDLSRYKSEAISSFAGYSFHNKRGMLQYSLLPGREKKCNKTVGLTPLHYLSNFSSGDNFIFMKDEGQNPSGCFKDRETLMCLLNSKPKNNVVIYSSGNAAASAALMLQDSPRQLVTFVPGDTYPEKIDYIRDRGSDVVIIGDQDTSFEDGYQLFADINAAHIFSEHGFDNWSVINPYRVQGDKTIAVEIVKQLSPRKGETIVPDYVIVPTANGSCLAGMWKGFNELYKAGIIEKLPKMISAGIENANPVNKAVQQNKTDEPVQCDLSKTDDENANIGSIILAKEGYDSIQAARAVKESNGLAIGLNASDMRRTFIEFFEKEKSRALKHAILPEPASLTSLAALKKIPDAELSSGKHIAVSVSTGHGLKAWDKIETLLENNPKLQVTAKIITSKREKAMKTAPRKTGNTVSAKADLSSVLEAFFELQKVYRSEPIVQPV